MSTLQMVRDCVRESTIQFCEDGSSCVSTDEIAKQVNISRSVASKYLNQLAEEKQLIKISTRPVIFFDCQVIETRKNVEICNTEFLSIGEFLNYIQSRSRVDGFKEVVGYKGSLNEAVIKLKTYVKYPMQAGISLAIISGERGTGKKLLSESLFHYAQSEGLIEENQKFYTFSCIRERENIRTRLFGRRLKDARDPGFLQMACGSILYVSNGEEMDGNIQHLLSSCLEEGNGADGQGQGVRLILSTTKKPQEAFESRLLEKASVIVELPSLEERTLKEKEKLVHRFLSAQARNLDKEITISNYAFHALVRCHYENNVDGLIRAVQTTCANAGYSRGKKDRNLEIYLYHLPEEIMPFSLEEDVSEDKHMLRLDEIKENLLFDSIMVYYNEVLARYRDYRDGTLGEEEFIRRVHESLNRYCDFIIFEKNPFNQRIESYKGIIDNIFDIVSSKFKVVVYANCASLLAKIIYKLTYVDDDVQEWEKVNRAAIEDIKHVFMNRYRDEYFIAQEITDLILRTMDIELNSMNFIFLVLNIHFYNKSSAKNRLFGLIVAHGYSTASSIADSCNRLLGHPVLSAIDMPLDVTVDGIVELVKKMMQKKFYYQEMILLVDMGSLEQLGERLADVGRMRIGMLDNISTKIALEVGEKIMADMDMETILSTVCQETRCSYHIFGSQKKDAIIFTTEIGALSTDRVIEVFRASVPRKVGIEFVSYDYNALVKGGLKESVFEEYNVLLIAGTVEIRVGDIPYMAIEDVIAFKDMEKLNSIYSRYLNEEEIRVFNTNLIKNFSLGNIMQSLTILNANILLGYIERAVSNLSRDLTLSLKNKIVLRLYIHLSCMVERLVTKAPMTAYDGLEEFEKEHGAFIRAFRKNFQELCAHYNVEIPLSEIAFLYDYIFSDCI